MKRRPADFKEHADDTPYTENLNNFDEPEVAFYATQEEPIANIFIEKLEFVLRKAKGP